jgi:2'-5' RNA ligase
MSTFQDELLFKQKYLKYKNKYLDLKVQEGGLFNKSDSSVLVFHKNSCKTLTDAIDNYRNDIVQAEKEDVEGQGILQPVKTDKTKIVSKKSNVTIKSHEYNGNPTLFKYTLGDKEIKPIFYIHYRIINNKTDKKEREIEEKKIEKIKKQIEDLTKKYKILSSFNLTKDKHPIFVERMGKINCDTLNLKGNRTIRKIYKNILNNITQLSTQSDPQAKINPKLEILTNKSSQSNRLDILNEFKAVEVELFKIDETMIKTDGNQYPLYLGNYIDPNNIKLEDFSFIIINSFKVNPDNSINFNIESINEIIGENGTSTIPPSTPSSPSSPRQNVTTTDAPIVDQAPQ